MGEDVGKSRRQRFLEFCRKVALIIGIDAGLSMVVWLVVGLFQGRFSSFGDAFFWGSFPLFAVAALVILYDMGSSLVAPVQMLTQKKKAGSVIEEARQRTRSRMRFASLFFVAGAVMLFLSVAIGLLLGE